LFLARTDVRVFNEIKAMSATDETVKREAVLAALSGIAHPAGGDIVSRGMIQGLAIRDGHVGFMIEVAPSEGARFEPLRRACEEAVERIEGVKKVTAVLTAHHDGPAHNHGHGPSHHRHGNTTPAQSQPQLAPGVAPERRGIPGVANIIAVASGKGGVGKSTVAVNLALALSSLGQRVGLLDADIYGPSVPHLLGIKEKPVSDGKKLQPILRHGVKTMSIGFLVDVDTPMIWRGPMVMSALTQMLNDVNWGTLDIMVVDMPPGTGDAQLTMAQRVPLAGAVIVSTPQDIALIDARKGLAMFRKTDVPVLGIIENMSTFFCPNCGHETHVFGHGGARRTAQSLGCEFLGEIPLDLSIRETSDTGTPIVALSPASREAGVFTAIATLVAAQLEAGSVSKPPPRIVVI
jgi:ATP-binding protein involved in chromosome partitioning